MVTLLKKDTTLKNKLLKPNKTVRNNIQKIQKQCNSLHSNQAEKGNAALNRNILLDPVISPLMNVDTLITILAHHANLADPRNVNQNSPIALLRQNGIGNNSYISMASALIYGFENGSDVIKNLPNNNAIGGLKAFEEQQENFELVTGRIIKNILLTATNLGIDPFDEKYQMQNSNGQSLLTRFSRLNNSIQSIKNAGLSDRLLVIPSAKAEAIRSQSYSGIFSILFHWHTQDENSVKFEYRKNNDTSETGDKQLIITKPDTLQEFAKRFILDKEALVHRDISHGFYDPLHIAACLEQDKTIVIGDQEYTLAQIMEEMVKQATQNADGVFAMQQFETRFSVLENRLNKEFPEHSQVVNNQQIPLETNNNINNQETAEVLQENDTLQATLESIRLGLVKIAQSRNQFMPKQQEHMDQFVKSVSNEIEDKNLSKKDLKEIYNLVNDTNNVVNNYHRAVNSITAAKNNDQKARIANGFVDNVNKYEKDTLKLTKWKKIVYSGLAFVSSLMDTVIGLGASVNIGAKMGLFDKKTRLANDLTTSLSKEVLKRK